MGGFSVYLVTGVNNESFQVLRYYSHAGLVSL